MVAPPPYRRCLEILSQNFAICAPTLAQRAAVAAFDARGELEGHVARYAENRKLVVETLLQAGIVDLAPADGAFYVYADFSAFTDDSLGFCREMLKDIFVATTPGVDFDPQHGQKMVRFSYCIPTERVREACRRLPPYLQGL
jgi:aspartate/methionine/tyrosine aminotransferase